MRTFLALACLLLAPPQADRSAPTPTDPLSALERFELDVVHWEGTFGTYLQPDPGWTLILDLARLGTREVLGVLHGEDRRLETFDLANLARVHDRVEGDPEHGWTRRIVLAGRSRHEPPERIVLELVVQHEVERDDPTKPARKLTSNETHLTLRLHTLRDDDTLREYARAGRTVNRDSGRAFPHSR